jgi:hypothetical protein
MIRALLIPVFVCLLSSCTAYHKWSVFDSEDSERITPSASHEAAGLHFLVEIAPRTKDHGIRFAFHTTSAGPPFRARLTAGSGSRKVGKIRISKFDITLPDQSVYDALGGKYVEIEPKSYEPDFARYDSTKLPLKFKEGARITVEIQCRAEGKEIVIRKSFIGKKGKSSESIWDYYWSIT